MAGDIVPIELGLTDGDLVTLWAPNWREGDEEWEGFLGRGDDLYAFPSVARLAAFVRSNTDNDLVDHPAWPVVSRLAAAELEPDVGRSFDVIGVPELVAGSPDPRSVSELQDTFDIVSILGDVCDLDAVTKFFERPEIDAVVRYGVRAFDGRDGFTLWDEIGAAVVADWDAVIDALDGVVTTPEVDAAVVAEIESELVASDENEVEADDAVDDAEDEEYEFIDDEPEDLWTSVGIDPVKIITSEGELFTLRCYLDDDAVFLGSEGAIFVFGSERALARYLADNHEHDLATLGTYEDIRHAATDGSLDVTVTDDNVYVLTGIADDIIEGIDAIDPEQVELAVELFTDAANYVGDDSTDAALVGSTDLGLLVNYVVEPEPGSPAPSAPFEAEAQAWRELEREFEARLRSL